MEILGRVFLFLVALSNLSGCEKHNSSAEDDQSIQGAPTANYADWISNYFPNPADRDPLADPDQDGLSNLEEYAMGTNPTAPSARPIRVFYTTVGAEKYLALEFPILAGATDLTINVEVTPNLQDWKISPNPVVVTDAFADPHHQTLLARWVSADPVSQTSRQIARVRFSLRGQSQRTLPTAARAWARPMW